MDHLTGKIDAGGPYGGPSTFEGDSLALTVTTSDPSILFFRWDFDNDSTFDFPDQSGAGDLGRWTTLRTVTHAFDDDADGEVVVEGWDGVSQIIRVDVGDNLGQRSTADTNFGFGGYTFAWQFRAKRDMDLTELGHYHDADPLFEQAVWARSGALLGRCTPDHAEHRWNWCKLPSAVGLVQGDIYRISIRIGNRVPAIVSPPDNERTEFQGTYYCTNPPVHCIPSVFYTSSYIPLIDFRWREVHILPDPGRDTARIEVHNLAPMVYGIGSDPSPAPEFRRSNLSARFDDPGLGDDWEYRWTLPSGSYSDWLPVTRVVGGAEILILHTYSGEVEKLRALIADACGTFCLKIDLFDFGPLGQERVPGLSEVTPYDVLVVGTNYLFSESEAIGDLLADYMDAAGATGGGVVILQGGLDNAFECQAGICGRWDEEEYSPVPRGYVYGPTGDMGTVHALGHPILDGISSVKTNALAGKINTVNAGATRVVDWADGRVLGGVRTNPMVNNGARSAALNFFPLHGYTEGDFDRLIANSVRWASRQPDPLVKTMPIELDPFTAVFPDDDPVTATHQDAIPLTVEVRDDDGGADAFTGTINVTNVDATVVDFFDAAERDPNGEVLFQGFRIEDPALWTRTEWFAYAWDFGDGTPAQWVYQGNMTPPQFDVLLLHTLCLSGDSCSNYTALRDVLLGLDDVSSVDGFNFINYPGLPQAPNLNVLLAHDVVIVAMNWAYASYQPWEIARREVGNRLAQYIDADGGGVVTLMTTYDRSPTLGDAVTLAGRYVDDKYGPFEKAEYAPGDAALGPVLDADHDLLVGVRPAEVESSTIHSGDYAATIGGSNESAGRNGTLLARWSDGNSAVGIKVLANGRRTVHLGLSWTIAGEDTPFLLRNAIGWAAGGIPTPKLAPITHQFGNNTPYIVDLMTIDDDMGWAWNPANAVPIEVIPPATVSHRYITIT